MARLNLRNEKMVTAGGIDQGDIYVGPDETRSMTMKLVAQGNTGLKIISSTDMYGNPVASGTGYVTLGIDMNYINANIAVTAVDWNTLQNKPASFNPSAHTHPISEIIDLQVQLNSKASVNHTHTWSQISDAPNLSNFMTLTGNQSAAGYKTFTGGWTKFNNVVSPMFAFDTIGTTSGPDGTTAIWSDAPGYIRFLTNGEVVMSVYESQYLAFNKYGQGNMMGINTTAAYMLAVAWDGTIIEVPFETSISWSAITGKPTSFNPSYHTHAISDIIDLQVQLNSKAAANHTHDASIITSGVFPASRLGNSVGTEGDVLMIKNGVPKWWQAADTVPTHAHRLVDLIDFEVANPQGGQLLRYNTNLMKWANWTPNFLTVAGFPAAGYIPVFNADGFTYWQPPSGGGLSGSGFNGSLARWNNGTLTDSIFYGNGTYAGIGTGTFVSSATLTIKATQTYGMYMTDSSGYGIAFITNYGAAAFAHDITGFYSFSDARLKNSIRPLDQKEVAEKLMQLNPVYFKWNDREEAGNQVGFIAQEVEQIFPEIVRETERFDGKKYKIVDYEKATALLLAGYKELVERVKQLENK